MLFGWSDFDFIVFLGPFIIYKKKTAIIKGNKLGLSWAKLSPSWDFGLIEISLNRVETSLSKYSIHLTGAATNPWIRFDSN